MTERTQFTRNPHAIGLGKNLKFIRFIKLPADRRKMRKMQSVLPTPELRAPEPAPAGESEAAE